MMKKILSILMMLAAAASVAAQKPHTYYCDFEDATENAKWNLNKPKNENYSWQNLWCIGGAVASLGEKSMYISPDGGRNVGYLKDQSRIMIAWRELDLEAGRYDVAFDWMCGGDSTRAALLVGWVPESRFSDMACALNDDYKAKKWIADNLLPFDRNGLLTGGSVWTHAVDTLVSDGTPHRLVFMFVYSSSAQLVQPGPCVDNIQFSRNNCGVPTDMKAKTQGMNAAMSWTSEGESFNLRIHRMGDNYATVVNGIKQNSFSSSLQEGVYDIQIQVVCEGDTSVWYNFPTAFIYETKCFDYLDLTDERCLFSMETASDYHDNDSLLKPGRIDKGFTSAESRHTIHYHPEEYDARTYGSIDSKGNFVMPLKTVPDGALASVRIGSWEKTARVARVEYDFTVDANEAAVLMLQYAMVLESSGHGEKDRPRLTIDIVDAETGAALSRCTTVDLAAQTSGEGWYRVPDGGDGSRDVCWRDWTTLGLNLADFDGRHVKVKISVYGCTATIHYGYAYFTLTCTSGKLKGLQCGWTPTNEFIAPEGFNYRWYRLERPTETLSREQVYKVDYRDTRDYAVELSYKTDATCGFTLYANAIPRFPIPEATYKLEQRDCGNYITFTNTSHIRTRNWTTGEQIDTSLPPEYLFWDFGGLIPEGLNTPEKRWNPSFRLPDEEANYHFQLTAGVGLCDSTQHIYIHVPKVGKDSIVEKKQLCEGEVYRHNGAYYVKDTVITDRDYNRAGCDSIHVVDLRFVDAIRDTVEAVIPEGGAYAFGGKTLTENGDYTATFSSASGCDSIVTLRLRVVVPLEMEITAVEFPCPKDASFLIYTHARKGIPDFYSLEFGEEGQQSGFFPQQDSIKSNGKDTIEVALPMGVQPGYYPFSIRFESKINGKDTVSGEVMIHYPASLIQQRWDDVLGVLNSVYNGGYDFTGFQWYRNGEVIDGATDSYYFTPDKLQPGDEYAVLLYIDEEQRPISTCVYVVPARGNNAPESAPKKVMKEGRLMIIVGDKIYNAQGNRIE